MIRARFALAIVLIIPTIAFGQRKGKMGAGEGAAANWDDVAKDKAPAGPTVEVIGDEHYSLLCVMRINN